MNSNSSNIDNKLDVHVAAYKGENIYDFDNEILLNWYPERIILKSAGARSLLELGLGHGFTTQKFSNTFVRHVVLEGSPAVIQNFRARFPECSAEIIETFFEDFTTEEKFDTIVMGFILEHVDNPLEIIRHYRTFLAPGGKLFLAVPNAEALNRRLGFQAGLLENMQTLSENDLLLGHKRFYTVSSLTEEVTQAGYKIDVLEGIYLKPFTTNQLISLNLSKEVIQALCETGISYPELCCGMLAQITALSTAD